MVFRSKIDYWFLALIEGIFSVATSLSWDTTNFWIPLSVNGGILLLIAISVFGIKYIIQENQLVVRGLFFTYKRIDILQIRKISQTYSPLSAPAASFNRLEIIYNQFDDLLISPKNQQAFIEELLKINPQIEVKLRK